MKLFCSISKELLSTWKGALGAPFFFFFGYTQRYEVVAFFIFAAADRKWETSEGGEIRNKEGNQGENASTVCENREEKGDALLIKTRMYLCIRHGCLL